MAKVAVVLSGCGHQDGSEIHEAVLGLLEIDSQGHHYQIFAPNKPQAQVVNHITHQATGEVRNCLVESARIARGEISDLKQLHEKNFDALFFPGGFGAATNLCDFASKRAECSVDPDVAKVVEAFYKAKKPIGAACIAPVILAKTLGQSQHITMTLGTSPQEQTLLQQMGVEAKLIPVKECLVDLKSRIYTTPCYMEHASIAQIHQGIKQLIKHMLG